jgi:hypothetical protein
LDFHTSEAIGGIGAKFSADQFQEQLKRGHVDSVTVFSKCHHGWAYHPSDANETHPHLTFDLLGAQIEAAHAIGVNTPVYLSAGLDEKEARRHPEWLLRDGNDRTSWTDTFLKPGYHRLCMNSPYLDVLVKQIEEVVQRYDADGIFLDIVGVQNCLCHNCLATLVREGKDPADPANVLDLAERVYANYANRTNDAVHKVKAGLPVFHNGGHIVRGRRDLARLNTHLELESLPTGGWGYDHFPLSARYAATLDMDYLGMTGKFHTSWGEFGGFKHPNALRYEAALSIAMGAKCGIGDQLHPSGEMSPATYALIGAAYAQVEQKEKWCGGAANVADIALLSVEAATSHAACGAKNVKSDVGAVRMLLEGHFLFDVIDTEADFSAYKVLILPDHVRLSPGLVAKARSFVNAGGRVLATGESGLSESADAFVLDFGATWTGVSDFQPSYFHPAWNPAPLQEAAFVMYSPSQNINVAENGEAYGYRDDPYFNRTWEHFSSHQHTPNRDQNSGPGMVLGPDGVYVAWAVFEDYASKGSLICRKIVEHALNMLLPDKTLSTNLPAQGIATLTVQLADNRYVCHMLYGSPVRRGENVDVIEDLVPILDTQVTIRVSRKITRVYLAPQGMDLPFTQEGAVVSYVLPRFECHQIVVLDYPAE